MIQAVFFDLDGTLLGMDQNQFIQIYFGTLARKMQKQGIDGQKAVHAVGKGTLAMVHNDGSMSNQERFWKVLEESGLDPAPVLAVFEDFYQHDFSATRHACQCRPESRLIIEALKARQLRLVMATNPLFPYLATEQRIRWAALNPDDFLLITTYENCRYCKPDLRYYTDLLTQTGLSADEVLMVGNDTREDLVVRKLGMRTALITNDLIDHDEPLGSTDFKGTLAEFYQAIQAAH